MKKMENQIPFSRLYESYYRRSLCFVRSYVRDVMVAEDIVSEAIIQLWEISKKGKVDHPLALLTLILKSKSLNYLKHQAIEYETKERMSEKQIREMHYRIISLEACDPNEMFSEEISRLVQKALTSLPEQTQKIFKMSRYEQMPVKEIAARMNITPKSVEYHITKALKVLRIALKDYLPLFYLLFL